MPRGFAVSKETQFRLCLQGTGDINKRYSFAFQQEPTLTVNEYIRVILAYIELLLYPAFASLRSLSRSEITTGLVAWKAPFSNGERRKWGGDSAAGIQGVCLVAC